MSPDGIQGPPSSSPSSEALPASVGSRTAQDPASSISEGCKLVIEENHLSVSGPGAPFCREDEHSLRILHSPTPITPPLGSPSLDIPEILPSSVQVMSDEVDSFHATTEKIEVGNSAIVRHAPQKLKTPSPSRTRRRYYDSLISPGKEALKAVSTNTVFYRPDLDEIEEWTKAYVSPAVFGQPSYRKPLAGLGEERSAIRCNLRMLIKTIKLHPTSTPTTTRSRSFSVQYVPQSMQSELMIESIFGSTLGDTESKTESVSRVSPGPDAEPSEFRDEQPDVTPMLLDNFSLKRSSQYETNEHHESNRLQPVNAQPSVLKPNAPPLATSSPSPDSTSFLQTTFKADLSNPLHQPGTPRPRTSKSNSSPLPAPNAIVKRTPKSLSDPSFNPDFPLTLSPAIQRSFVFPLSPCSNVFQAQPSDMELSNEHITVTPAPQIAEPHAPEDEAASLPVAEPLSLSLLGSGALPAPGTLVHKDSKHLYIALGPLLASSLSSLPISKGPNKHVRYVRLEIKSPMASPIWNEVESLPLDADTEPPEVSFGRKRCPVVLESGFLHPRYRDLWASDPNNDFLLHAKDNLKIAKVHILYAQNEDGILVKEEEEAEVDELESDELVDDTEDVEMQDSASGVVFLSQPYRDRSVASPIFSRKKKSRKGLPKSGLNLVVDAAGKESRGSMNPYESASTRRPAKRSRTVSAQGEPSPNKRHRALAGWEVESEDESDRAEDAVGSVKQNLIPKTRTQQWSSLLHSFLKGKRRLEQVDIHEISQALREIESDPYSIIPNSPLADYIRTIANLESSDFPDNDRMRWRPLAQNILRFWGPETTTLKIAAGSGSTSSSQPIVLSSSGQ